MPTTDTAPATVTLASIHLANLAPASVILANIDLMCNTTPVDIGVGSSECEGKICAGLCYRCYSQHHVPVYLC